MALHTAHIVQTSTRRAGFFSVPATGKQVKFVEYGSLRFAGGKVVKSWYGMDMLGLMRQLSVHGDA